MQFINFEEIYTIKLPPLILVADSKHENNNIDRINDQENLLEGTGKTMRHLKSSLGSYLLDL